jgi:hypothetical protein
MEKTMTLVTTIQTVVKDEEQGIALMEAIQKGLAEIKEITINFQLASIYKLEGT